MNPYGFPEDASELIAKSSRRGHIDQRAMYIAAGASLPDDYPSGYVRGNGTSLHEQSTRSYRRMVLGLGIAVALAASVLTAYFALKSPAPHASIRSGGLENRLGGAPVAQVAPHPGGK